MLTPALSVCFMCCVLLVPCLVLRVCAAVAHHVQKKATRGHNAYRPKKSRPSDIYRKPPSYPAFPDIPWYTKLEEKGSTTTTAASQ